MHSETTPLTWLITGANGNLGKRLISTLLHTSAYSVAAVVRSERARDAIAALELTEDARARLTVTILDYTDVAALKQAASTCNKAVHLVGILKQTKQASYAEAHERSTEALLEALQDTPVDHLTYMSIVGSTPTSNNACLASKGRAEALCLQHPLKACVLRVPMVLGEGDYASHALAARAKAGRSMTFRAASMEQPIYAGDVVRAIMAAGELSHDGSLDLGGPEALSRRDLTQRAAAVVGGGGAMLSLPLGLGLAMAGLMELLLSNPPVTRAMLDVLDHDDDIDPQPACEALGLDELTPLDDTLRAVLT